MNVSVESPTPAVTMPATPLTDGTIALRPWKLADAPAMQRIFADEEMYRWTDAVPGEPVEEFELAIRRGWQRARTGERACFAITDPDGAVVGAIDLMFGEFDRAEIGYALGNWTRGHGYATRAVDLLTTWAFTATSTARIELPIPTGNRRSRSVAERARYTYEGTLRSYLQLRDGGERYDVTMYAAVRGEHPPS